MYPSSYLFALLLYPHLIESRLKLANKVVLPIGVPVPDGALEQETYTCIRRPLDQFDQLQHCHLNTHTRALEGMQGNAMLND